MAINVRCECGKQFRAKDEYAGRRGICPACKLTFDIPESNTSKPAEPEPAKRPWWRDPIVVIGTTIPTLLLAVFFGYLAWPRYKTRQQRGAPAKPVVQEAKTTQLLQEANTIKVVKVQPTATKSHTGPSQADIDRWLPAATELAKMEIKSYFEKYTGFENPDIGGISVKAVPFDERKRPWLWQSTAIVAAYRRGQQNGAKPKSTLFTWHCQFLVGDDTPTRSIWVEMIESATGETTRKHFKESEWTLKFRDQIERAWSSELRVQGTDQKTISAEQVGAVATVIADRFGVGGFDVVNIVLMAD